MKKISILLSVMLLAFAVSCSSPNKPEETPDTSNYITLAERVGNYVGDMGGNPLEIVFDNNGQVTSVKLSGVTLQADYPIVVGQPTDKSTKYTFTVDLVDDHNQPTGVKVGVEVNFDSPTEATGGKAYIDLGSGFDYKNPIPVNKVNK
ncbi:hypothetical protein [Brachyspira pulli]|uniref:hypothetical protein n=1 Tax=Brachyspira pulli TaxID=310721 RepID=UPI00300673FD